jgi:glycosyltransferase involved in cell wall biosynthesis
LRAIAAVTGISSPYAWNQFPRYFHDAAKQSGFAPDLVTTPAGKGGISRLFYKGSRALTLRASEGFELTAGYVERSTRDILNQLGRIGVRDVLCLNPQLRLSHYSKDPSLRVSYYIDAPLQALFEELNLMDEIDERTGMAALEAEMEEYDRCDRILTTSEWAANYLIRNYKVKPEKVATVLPGANLTEATVSGYLERRGAKAVPDSFSKERPFRILFLGAQWERKGLRRLVGAMKLLAAMDLPLELHVVGCIPEVYQPPDFLHVHGYIDKTVDERRFLDLISHCDLAVFPSHSEPMALAPLECLRLGVPILCSARGGLVDVGGMARGAAILAQDCPWPPEIAALIEPLIREPYRLQGLSDTAWALRSAATWERAVTQLNQKMLSLPTSHQGRPQHLPALRDALSTGVPA